MVSDLVGEDFFQDLVTAALKDVTGVVLPGSNVALALVPHVSRAFFAILSRNKRSDQQGILDSLARVPFGRAFGIAAKQVAETDLDKDQQEELLKYLSAIPMTSRQALHRWDDGGHVTTLISQLPQGPDQMARFVPIRPPRFRPGYKVPGHDLRLDTLLGQGGFAEVWKARSTAIEDHQPVALKFCLDSELLPSLKREIELLHRLDSGNAEKDFVQLLQTAYSAEPPFLVYEYIDGGNLTNWLDSFADKVPTPADVVSVLKMTARAIAVAHDAKIVHRDLKPANLLITRTGRVKVADFGIGALTADAEARTGGGQTDASINPTVIHGAYTPIYSDPMRARLAPPDPRDDVYAIGVIGYQLLLGSVASRMEGGWRRHLEMRGVPAGLIEVIDTCVAPFEQRYVDAGALLAALEAPPEARKPKTRKPQANAAPKTEATARFCHNCGARRRPDRAFCTNCGYRYPDTPA